MPDWLPYLLLSFSLYHLPSVSLLVPSHVSRRPRESHPLLPSRYGTEQGREKATSRRKATIRLCNGTKGLEFQRGTSGKGFCIPKQSERSSRRLTSVQLIPTATRSRRDSPVSIFATNDSIFVSERSKITERPKIPGQTFIVRPIIASSRVTTPIFVHGEQG